VLRKKVMKLCEGFNANPRSYNLPSDGQGSEGDFRNELAKLDKDIRDLSQIISVSQR
jgi:hypothetical protein